MVDQARHQLGSTITCVNSVAVLVDHCISRDLVKVAQLPFGEKINRSSSFRLKDCGRRSTQPAALLLRHRNFASLCSNFVLAVLLPRFSRPRGSTLGSSTSSPQAVQYSVTTQIAVAL